MQPTLGHDAFTAQHVQQRCDSTCTHMYRLVGLPLDLQTKWSVPHDCLKNRKARFILNTWWHLLAAPLREFEGAQVRGIRNIAGCKSLTNHQWVQVQLPRRHGGMWLRRFSKGAATDARLLSAALAHAALASEVKRSAKEPAPQPKVPEPASRFLQGSSLEEPDFGRVVHHTMKSRAETFCLQLSVSKHVIAFTVNVSIKLDHVAR